MSLTKLRKVQGYFALQACMICSSALLGTCTGPWTALAPLAVSFVCSLLSMIPPIKRLVFNDSTSTKTVLEGGGRPYRSALPSQGRPYRSALPSQYGAGRP